FTLPPTTAIDTLSLHDALPILEGLCQGQPCGVSPVAVIHGLIELVQGSRTETDGKAVKCVRSNLMSKRQRARGLRRNVAGHGIRSEEHTSELQSRENLVCRLLL